MYSPRLLLGLTLLATLITAPVMSATPPTEVLAAWTQFVAHAQPDSSKLNTRLRAPRLQLRFAVNQTNQCSDFGVAFKKSDKSTGTVNTLTARDNPNTKNFPINVCVLDMDQEWEDVRVIANGGDATMPTLPIKGANLDVASLPGPHKIGTRHTATLQLNLVTLGDTGCRSAAQDCDNNNPSLQEWPFAQVIQHALKEKPDLVVHAGDYRYYGGHASAGTKSWDYWNRDLLIPARSLLLAAPWAFARGNHESCFSRRNGLAGPGYFYLFGPDANTVCTDEGSQSWYFDIAAGGFNGDVPVEASHRFVVIDSALPRSRKLAEHFAAALDMSNQESTWWVSHIPSIDRLKFNDQKGDREIKKRLNKAMKTPTQRNPLCDTTRKGMPSCRPSTLIMSHDHMLQTVTFQDDNQRFTFPQSYIVGHGGVDLRGAGLNSTPCVSDFDLPNGHYKQASVPNDFKGVVRVSRSHGYVVWNRSGQTVATENGWVATPKFKNGTKMPRMGNSDGLPTGGGRLGGCLH